jgi:hypothetical protein
LTGWVEDVIIIIIIITIITDILPNTCYVIHGRAGSVLRATSEIEDVKYSFPVPATIKLAPGLFDRLSDG